MAATEQAEELAEATDRANQRVINVHEIHFPVGVTPEDGIVTPEDSARYAEDGVVVLRGVLGSHEVEALRGALDKARAEPGRFSGRMGAAGGWTDKFLWRSVPAVRHAALESRLVGAVGQLMQTRQTNLLCMPSPPAPTLSRPPRPCPTRVCASPARVMLTS